MKDDFAAAGAQILGVSKDSPKRHDKFMEKESLNFLLGSDEDGHVCEDYGVWIEKSKQRRKKYMGIERSTFLINAHGEIAQEWRKVKVKGHVAEVLEAAQALWMSAAEIARCLKLCDPHEKCRAVRALAASPFTFALYP